MQALEVDPELGTRDASEPGRVLVVDSDPDLRNVVTGCLLELGYEVSCAASGDEAVRLVANALHAERGFDVVILDIMERDSTKILDSFALMRRLDSEISVIATSTWPHAAWLVDYFSFGFDAALPKPWRFVDLAMTLNRVVDRGKNRQHSETRIKCDREESA